MDYNNIFLDKIMELIFEIGLRSNLILNWFFEYNTKMCTHRPSLLFLR